MTNPELKIDTSNLTPDDFWDKEPKDLKLKEV